MISSTHAVAWPGSMTLGGQMLNCSSEMGMGLSNWLAVGVVGNTNSPASPRLITPFFPGQHLYLHTDQLKQPHQLCDFQFLIILGCHSN